MTTNEAGDTVTLTWTATGSLPQGATAYLLDTRANKRVNMSTTSSYTYRVAREGETRALKVQMVRSGPRG